MAVALDFIDWEDTAKEGEEILKQDVKMEFVTEKHVQKSLATWLPKGEQGAIQDAMDILGGLFGTDAPGFCGKFDTFISKHFSAKDKKKLKDMYNTVSQFYRSVRAGGSNSKRRKFNM